MYSWTIAGACLASTSALVLGCGSPNGSEDSPRSQSSGGSTSSVHEGSGAGGSLGEAVGGTDSGGGGAEDAIDHAASELFSKLRIGWNLGNSLDVPEGETAWGNPAVSAGLFEAVKAHGFDLVRIPVTWSPHMGTEPNYVIDTAWMDRVEEVVTFAVDAGLYVVINLHHDGADDYAGVEWITLNDSNGEVTEANNDAVRTRFVSVWEQIAERFKAQDEHVLFESMNEIHDGYGAPIAEYHAIINQLNQVFVDTVRASGGNNAGRYLVVPGYNTNIEHTLAGFELPVDPTPDRLVLSVHYYDPWPFAGEGTTHVWGERSAGNDGWGQESSVVEQFDELRAAYLEKGIPVLMGEYGAVHQQGFEQYRRYYLEFVTKAARDRGILPVYWDNGGQGTGADAFGMIDRDTGNEVHPAALEAMLRAVTSSYTLAEIALPEE